MESQFVKPGVIPFLSNGSGIHIYISFLCYMNIIHDINAKKKGNCFAYYFQTF